MYWNPINSLETWNIITSIIFIISTSIPTKFCFNSTKTTFYCSHVQKFRIKAIFHIFSIWEDHTPPPHLPLALFSSRSTGLLLLLGTAKFSCFGRIFTPIYNLCFSVSRVSVLHYCCLRHLSAFTASLECRGCSYILEIHLFPSKMCIGGRNRLNFTEKVKYEEKKSFVE